MRGRRLATALSVLALATTGAAAAKAAPPAVTLEDGEVEATTVPPQKAGEHRVWWGDFAGGLYGRSFLFDTDTGELLATADTGWEGIKLDMPKDGRRLYNNALYMSRGFRGVRTDVVEILNAETLAVEGEIPVPAKAIRGWPNLNHSALTDDDRFHLLQFFTPASSIGVVDLKTRAYVGEIETAGCAHVMAAGPRRFFTLCGDGALLVVTLDEAGREAGRERLSGFFDPDKDPLHGTGVRSGDVWHMVTYRGEVRSLDVSRARPTPLRSWTAGGSENGSTWVPGEILQNLAFHRASGRLYMLMANASLEPKGGGTDYHRQAGTEVWVFDAASGRRLSRIPLSRASYAIAVSQDGAPRLYASSLWDPKLLVIDALSGRQLRTLDGGSTPTLIQPVEPR